MSTVHNEALLRAMLQNMASRHRTASAVPTDANTDYLTGFGAGYEAGQLSAMALALATVTDDSPARLVEDALGQAAIDTSFPFELHMDLDLDLDLDSDFDGSEVA